MAATLLSTCLSEVYAKIDGLFYSTLKRIHDAVDLNAEAKRLLYADLDYAMTGANPAIIIMRLDSINTVLDWLKVPEAAKD